MEMKIRNTTYHLVSKIEPEELRLFMLNEIGEKSKDKLYNCLKELAQSYPNFEKWFYDIVIPEIEMKNGTREIIIALSEIEDKNPTTILTGIAILKKTEKERKICTFRILDDYRNQGVGTELFEKCFEYLETRSPIITISENRKHMFDYHLDVYNFEETQQLEDYYIKGSTEYVYNGFLAEKSL